MAKKYASIQTLQTFLSNLKNLFATKSEVDEKSKVQIVETNETGTFIEDLQTLTIHKLTQEQYEEKLTNGDIDANALYLTPQEEIDLTPYATTIELNERLGGKANTSHSHAISDIDNLQPSLDSKTPTSRTINGKALTSNIVLTSSDVGAASSAHNHNDVYYTESKVDEKLAGKSNTTHKHDNDYDAKGSANNALTDAKSYTDAKTSNLTSTTTVDNKIGAHNTATSAHNDIRELISGLANRLNTLANSDDTTLDQMSEIVAYIKNNKSLIDGVTTSKVNVSDIVNNLTTSVANKPLSAAQGVAIKSLIDALQEEFDGHGHEIADIDGLTTTLANKAEKHHGTHVVYLVADPLMDGEASAGSANEVARADHRHPTDTSRAAKIDLDALEEVVAGKADSSHTHTNASLGQGAGYCSTSSSTAAKVVSLLNYKLVEGGIVSVEFVYSVPASATMNINNTGAREIYYRGEAITENIIKGADRATFIYYSYRYHLISVDRWHEDIVDLQATDGKVYQVATTANSNYPLLLARNFQEETTTDNTFFDSGVYLNPSTNKINANISGTATGLEGLDATVSELNFMSGVTSNVQTQLGNKTDKIAGIVHQYAGANAPDGYLLCDGSFYRTDEYTELFDAIGFTYGESGSGVNLMFAVPNLATRVPVGVGSGYVLGSTGGEAKHTLTVNELPKHDHGAVYTGNADAANKKYAWYTTTGDKIGYQAMESGSGAAHNNMQPYIALNYIISTGK